MLQLKVLPSLVYIAICNLSFSHLWSAVDPPSAAAVHVSGEEGDAHFRFRGVVLQALDQGLSLVLVATRIPVVHNIIQQLCMAKPAGTSSSALNLVENAEGN